MYNNTVRGISKICFWCIICFAFFVGISINVYGNIKTDFIYHEALSEVICTENNYGNLYKYIEEHIDPMFDYSCYKLEKIDVEYDDKNRIQNGILKFHYVIDGIETKIEYTVDFSGGKLNSIKRIGKVDYTCNTKYGYIKETNDEIVLPLIDGIEAYKRTVVIDAGDKKITKQDGKQFEHISIYISDSGKTMISTDDLANVLNYDISFDEVKNIIIFGEYNKYAPYRCDFKIDTKDGIIISTRNLEQVRKKIDVLYKDSKVYVPLRDVLNAVGIEDSRMTWLQPSKCLEISFTPNFNTDKITIGEIDGKYNAELNANTPHIVTITNKADIADIVNICTSSSFKSSTAEDPRIQGDCTLYIDFNNGTIIFIYDVGYDYGEFLGTSFLPSGIRNWAVSKLN